MSPTPPTITDNFIPEALPTNAHAQFVRVRVAGLELLMNTDKLSGVFQLSRQHRLTENNTVITAKGEFPVISLAEVVSNRLQVSFKEEFEGKALIAVEHDGNISMIRADSVSRPATIKPEHIHPMPRVAHNHASSRLIRCMANISPTSENPNECIRMVFDPLVALGHDVPEKSANEPNLLPKSASSAIAAAAATSKRATANGGTKTGQLLAFVPEDLAQSDVEYVFCLPLTAIAEVITTQQRLNSLSATDVFDGFVLWRQVPVPIVRLGKIFGFGSDQPTESSRRLVIARSTGNRFVGFYTKPQMQTMKVPTALPGKVAGLDGKPHRGCFRTEFGEMVVPDMNRILNRNF